MSYLIETLNYHGHDIEVRQAEDYDSPNDWDTEYGFLIYDHRDFSTAPRGMKSSDANDIYDRWSGNFKTYYWDNKFWWIFPVFAYIHGGVSLHLSRASANQYEPTGFDTSFKGFCLVNKTDPKMWIKEEAYKIAQEIVKEWNECLSGDVYAYTSEAGSCTGFYGEEGKKQMIEEAKDEIDYLIKQENKKKQNKLKILIQNNVPIEKRIKLLNLT